MPSLRFRDHGPYPYWEVEAGPVRVRFVGRGPETTAAAVLGAAAERAPGALAWLDQVHGDRVVEARGGCCGEADALVTDREALALAVVTADCVPVVLENGRRVAVAHAGWRGLEAGILSRAASSLDSGARAWIGPAIGPCCYEVSLEVARRLAAVSHESVLRPGPGPRPHVDLQAVAAWQLERAGIEPAGRVALCTRCHPDLLFSYRGQGPGGGRNLAFAWREVTTTGSSDESLADPETRPGAAHMPR